MDALGVLGRKHEFRGHGDIEVLTGLNGPLDGHRITGIVIS